jgi:hypothetical protein
VRYRLIAHWRQVSAIALIAWFVLLTTRGSLAQTASAAAVKAAFVYNFAKFCDWPADVLPADAPLVLCVIGDDALQDALEEAVKNKRIGGHALVVRSGHLDASLRACHLVYCSGLDASHARQLVDLIKDVPVLSVSDQDAFAAEGGVAQLYEDGGRIRFLVNVGSAQRAHLRVSSRLLSLAKIVKDDQHVVRR